MTGFFRRIGADTGCASLIDLNLTRPRFLLAMASARPREWSLRLKARFSRHFGDMIVGGALSDRSALRWHSAAANSNRDRDHRDATMEPTFLSSGESGDAA